MATTVTVSEFRENLSKYIDLVNEKGREVEIVDGRKGKVLAEIRKPKSKTRKKKFDWDEYMKFVRNMKPLFTDKDVEDIKKAREATNRRLKELNW